jgi:cytochrome b involved in lipid metabolism
MRVNSKRSFKKAYARHQWVIIDAKVYDLSKFKNLHPGGASVLLDPEVGEDRNDINVTKEPCLNFSSAGQDATEAFFGLHRYEVLERPQYQRLQIGVIAGEKSIIHGRVPGEISTIPYAEPTWLTPGYHSPYFSEVSLVASHPYPSRPHAAT